MQEHVPDGQSQVPQELAVSRLQGLPDQKGKAVCWYGNEHKKAEFDEQQGMACCRHKQGTTGCAGKKTVITTESQCEFHGTVQMH